MYERFTDRARKVMQLANQEAQRYNHEYIGTEHILLGLVKEGGGVAANVLMNLLVDSAKIIKDEVEKIVQAGPEKVSMAKLPPTPRAKKVLEYAIEEARALSHNYVGTEHLLLGVLREEEAVAAQILMNLGLSLEDVREEVLNLLGAADPESRSKVIPSKSKTPALDAFGRDLTELARQGKLDLVIGRQRQIEQVMQVLLSRTQNNPVLLGERGVGKSAIVRGLVQQVAANLIPNCLGKRRIVKLDLRFLGRDASVLERLTALLWEAHRTADVLIFIDGLHAFTKGSGLMELEKAAQLFLAAVCEGEVQCVATDTEQDYRRCLRGNRGLERCLQPILVAPPSQEETVAILRGLRPVYEAHHSARIEDSALVAAAELDEGLIAGLRQPGAAVQVIDRTAAAVRLQFQSIAIPQVQEIDAEIQRLNQEKEVAVSSCDFDKAASCRDKADKLMKHRQKLFSQVADSVVHVDADAVREIVSQLARTPS